MTRKSHAYRADVKQTRRTTYLDAGLTAHGRTLLEARDHFARIFDVPLRWVRVRRA